MTQEHPITPPPELIRDWCASKIHARRKIPHHVHLAIQAARWGADQELEACCEWLHWQNLATHPDLIPSLHTARRPKPPSLKELALLQLDTLNADLGMHGLGCDLSQIRRALEQLND